MPGEDLVALAAAELYARSPDAFTARRAELVAAARSAGDRSAAKAIGALRRPTRAAWVVNQLSRFDSGAAGRLAELGAALRTAQEAGDGRRLRELSAARGALLDLLVRTAFAAADISDPPPGLRAEVSATLEAAIADPSVARGVASGTLASAAEWAGFGPPPPDSGAAEAIEAERAAPERATPERATAERAASERAAAARERRAAEEAERAAAEAAERAERRRRAYEESERGVADAVAATASALAAEERLEGEVRDLEGRLTEARAELAAARLRARRAEAAERRARSAHGRLPRA